MLLVAAGGALGSVARYGLTLAVRPVGGWPVGVLAINVVGAFLLGVLLEVIARRDPQTPRTRALRLGLGTGVLGGFTTFATLAVDVEQQLAGGRAGLALAYGGASLVLGLLACAAGIATGLRIRGDKAS